MTAEENSILLSGLDGSNPLAFLAALGTLRTLALALSHERVCMSWENAAAAWRPRVSFARRLSEQEMIDLLHTSLKSATSRESFSIGDNLNLSASDFRKPVVAAAAQARNENKPDRNDADFLAAFGCESCADDKGIMRDTDLRTMSGGGHQHFLKCFRELVIKTEASHLRRTLLQTWDYSDDGSGLNLRWDPADDRRYALRWGDPGNSSRNPIKTMRGANRLAIEALPLLPTMPTASGLATTCFKGSGARNTFFHWPIWNCSITVDVVRSLLPRSLYFREATDEERSAAGVVGMFISQRILMAERYRNFAPARSI